MIADSNQCVIKKKKEFEIIVTKRARVYYFVGCYTTCKMVDINKENDYQSKKYIIILIFIKEISATKIRIQCTMQKIFLYVYIESEKCVVVRRTVLQPVRNVVLKITVHRISLLLARITSRDGDARSGAEWQYGSLLSS